MRAASASLAREYLAPRLRLRLRPRLRRNAQLHGRYVVTMKGVAFEDQKLLTLLSLSLVPPSALSYDWLLPGVENGVESCRRRTPSRAPRIRYIEICSTRPVKLASLGIRLFLPSFLPRCLVENSRRRSVTPTRPFHLENIISRTRALVSFFPQLPLFLSRYLTLFNSSRVVSRDSTDRASANLLLYPVDIFDRRRWKFMDDE